MTINTKWQYKTLQFLNPSQTKKLFDQSDWEYLERFNSERKKRFTEKTFLLASSPIFIKDNDKDNNNINDIFEYYYNKIKKDTSYHVFTFDNENKKFVKNLLEWSEIPFLNNWIENINISSSIDKKYLNISPYFFNNLLNIYKRKESSDPKLLTFIRNLHSLILLSDKVSLEEKNESLSLSFFNTDNVEIKYKHLSIQLAEQNVNSAFYYIVNWILENNDYQLYNLKLEVAKIYLSSITDLEKFNNDFNNFSTLNKDLDTMYKIILNKHSKKYYEYKNLLNEQYINLSEKEGELRNEINKKLLNISIFLPITIYGFYLTVFRTKQNFSLINSEFTIIYIFFLIATIFLIFSIKNEVTHLNKNINNVRLSINDIYKINETNIESTRTLKKREFTFQFIIIMLFIIFLLILIIFSNLNIITMYLKSLSKPII
ncbi:MAG: hypothetical protein E7K44_11645 [Staphylococcus lugdunensis]|nr:hypothetical protein [Staphylococcus lugdunensis]